jgi:MFS family permease
LLAARRVNSEAAEPAISNLPAESAPRAFARLLGSGPFARYMAGESISMVGSWMQMFAQQWVLTTLTMEATKLGWLIFAGGIPTLLLTMIGGSVADRYDKRKILYAALVVHIGLALLVGRLVETHQIAIWHLYVVTAFLGIVAAFEIPTTSALVPELVDRSDISRALAIDRAVFHFTRMIGPAMGGFIIARYGEPTAYYLNAASFIALILAIASLKPRPRGSDAEEEKRQGPMREGFDFVRRDPPTRAMVLLMMSATIFVSPFFMVTMPVYARGVLGLDSEHLGWLMAFSGVGSLTGALGLLAIGRGHRAMFVKMAAAIASLGLAGLAFAPSFWWAAPSIVLMTLGLSTAFGTANIVIQERAPDAIRGRVSAVAGMAFFGVLPFAGLAIAAVADHIGLRTAMASGAIGFAVVTTILLAGRKQLAAAPPVA